MLQFLMFIVSMMLTLYNIFNMGKVFDIKKSFVVLFLVLVCYFVGMILVLSTAFTGGGDTNLTYSILFKFQTKLLILYGILFIVQLFFYWRAEGVTTPQARNSIEARNNKE